MTRRSAAAYQTPVLVRLGRMADVTRKTFEKPGTKKDPQTPFRNRL